MEGPSRLEQVLVALAFAFAEFEATYGLYSCMVAGNSSVSHAAHRKQVSHKTPGCLLLVGQATPCYLRVLPAADGGVVHQQWLVRTSMAESPGE